MGKGTRSMGKMNKRRTHMPCRRCGKMAYHMRKGVCASCGFGASPRMRSYSWAKVH